MKLNTRNSGLLLLLFFTLLLVLATFQAPAYLIISDKPVKSDAVVLFLGNEKGTREMEARQLIREGLAEYLIIPARRQIHKRDPDGKLIRFEWKRPQDESLNTSHLKLKTASWLEDTHEEALIARDMMERLGIQSAIFVSSPYHMRRIMVIAGKIFNEGISVRYVPTRYEAPGEGFWLFNSYDCKFVLTEYMKIGWFLLYSPFV